MHAKALELAFHDTAPVWSVDISRTNRVITAGADKVARIWRLSSHPFKTLSRHAAPQTTFNPDSHLLVWLCDLRAHTSIINCCRFSRDGCMVATGDDQGEIILWTLDRDAQAAEVAFGEQNSPKERWIRLVTLRGHVQDVLDVAWSADGSRLISASVDNAIKVWDVRNTSRAPITLRNHANFVQGVAIDPFGRLLASMGNDRALRIFTANATTWIQIASSSSLSAPALDPDGAVLKGTDSRLFAGDARYKSFFRRLSWSPDGSILACPSGCCLPEQKAFAVHIFARNEWTCPVLQCGGLEKAPVAVRFSSVLYQLREDAPHVEDAPFQKFLYRMILAVACTDAVFFYDTQHMSRPFAMVNGLHCAEITDLSWAPDGLSVVISSKDGFLSIVCFSQEEIGEKLAPEHTPQWLNHHEELEQLPIHKSPLQKKVVSKVVPRPKTVSPSKRPPTIPIIPPQKTSIGPPIVSPQRQRPLPFPVTSNPTTTTTSNSHDDEVIEVQAKTVSPEKKVRRVYPTIITNAPRRDAAQETAAQPAQLPDKSMVSLAKSEQSPTVSKLTPTGVRVSLTRPANLETCLNVPDNLKQAEGKLADQQAVANVIKLEEYATKGSNGSSQEPPAEPVVDEYERKEVDMPKIYEMPSQSSRENSRDATCRESQQATKRSPVRKPAPVSVAQLSKALSNVKGITNERRPESQGMVNEKKPVEEGQRMVTPTKKSDDRSSKTPAKSTPTGKSSLPEKSSSKKRPGVAFARGRSKVRKVQTTLFSFTKPSPESSKPQNVLKCCPVSADKDSAGSNLDTQSAGATKANAVDIEPQRKGPPSSAGGSDTVRRKLAIKDTIDLT